jgi:hypothetical protein
MTAFGPWVATAYSLGRKPGTLENAMGFYRVTRVLGTAGIIAAIASQKRAEKPTVNIYQKQHQATHFLLTFCQCLSRLCLSLLLSAAAAAPLAITTKSIAGKVLPTRRNDSLTVLFRRFLCTALPAAFMEIAIPSLG